jgi:hypothetical protein
MAMHLRSGKRYYPVEHTPRKRRIVTSLADIERALRAEQHNFATKFFSLPRELRDNIYEHVWPHTECFVFKYRRISIAVSTSRDKPLHTWDYGLPSWILACKGMLHEAMATLHRTMIFSPISKFDYRVYIGGVVRRRACKNTLLFNSSIRNVCLQTYHGLMINPKDVSQMYWDQPQEMEQFAQQLRKVDARDLHLFFQTNLSFRHLWRRAQWEGEGCLLAPLEKFSGRCRAITLGLVCVTMRSSDREAHREAFVAIATRMAEGCAKEILDNDGGDVEGQTESVDYHAYRRNRFAVTLQRGKK